MLYKKFSLELFQTSSNKLGSFGTNCWDCAVRLFLSSLSLSTFQHCGCCLQTQMGGLSIMVIAWYGFLWKWVPGFGEGHDMELMAAAALEDPGYSLRQCPWSSSTVVTCHRHSAMLVGSLKGGWRCDGDEVWGRGEGNVRHKAY